MCVIMNWRHPSAISNSLFIGHRSQNIFFFFNINMSTGVSGIAPPKYLPVFESASYCNISLSIVRYFERSNLTG